MKKIIFLSIFSLVILAGCGSISGQEFKSEESVNGGSIASNKDSVSTSVTLIGSVDYVDDSSADGLILWLSVPETENVENEKFITDAVKIQYDEETTADQVTYGDFVELTGVVSGLTGEDKNVYDLKDGKLIIAANTVTKLDSIDVISPVLNTIDTIDSQTESKVKVEIEKIDFAPNQTRVFVTITNNSKSEFRPRTFEMYANSKVMEETYGFYGLDFEDLPYSIPAGKTGSGVVMFDAIDSESAGSVELYFSGYDDNYDKIEMEFDVI